MMSNKNSLVDYQDWTKKKAGKLVSIDFIRFGIVGTSGFVINTIFLTIFYKILHVPLLISQIIAAEIALTSNFTLHNLWTYKNAVGESSWVKKFIIFQGSSWSGIAITTLILLLVVNVFHKNYLVGLILGSALAMVWNYIWTKFIIFRRTGTS